MSATHPEPCHAHPFRFNLAQGKSEIGSRLDFVSQIEQLQSERVRMGDRLSCASTVDSALTRLHTAARWQTPDSNVLCNGIINVLIPLLHPATTHTFPTGDLASFTNAVIDLGRWVTPLFGVTPRTEPLYQYDAEYKIAAVRSLGLATWNHWLTMLARLIADVQHAMQFDLFLVPWSRQMQAAFDTLRVHVAGSSLNAVVITTCINDAKQALLPVARLVEVLPNNARLCAVRPDRIIADLDILGSAVSHLT